MKQFRKGKRLFAILLSVLLAVSGLPTAVFAKGKVGGGVCEHHQEHTADCGYTEFQSCEYSCELCGELTERLDTDWDSDLDTEPDSDLDMELDSDLDTELDFDLDTELDSDLDTGLDSDLDPKPDSDLDTDDKIEQVACTLLEGCSLEDNHEGECMIKLEDSEKDTLCSLTEGCILPDGHEGECETELPLTANGPVKTITGWTFMEDNYLNEGDLALQGVNMENQMDFDTVVSLLPTGILAEVEGVTDSVKVDITGWNCKEYGKDTEENWPVTGEYIFTADLPESFACLPLPTVKVLIGGAELYTGESAFKVTGTTDRYRFEDPELIIKDGANVTIQNKNPTESTLHRIKVEPNANVSITLDGVNINLSANGGYASDCAFDMTGGATVNLTLVNDSNNILKSGANRAGLEVPDGSVLTIGGNGKLEATSLNAAGIGGGYYDNGGRITIQNSANVKATSTSGAGIGGGGYNGSNGDNITIKNSANVTATSADGAGIGGGYGGNGGTITIKDSAKVTATSSNQGAGIGGGYGGNGGNVTIKDSAEVTAKGNHFGAGIGGGYYAGFGQGDGGTVKISGQGTKVTAEGYYDVGGGLNSSAGGSLSVTDGATLEMQGTGTNVKNPEYKNCTIINPGKTPVKYGALSLAVSPASFQTSPVDVTLTAILSGINGNANQTIEFTGSGTYSAITDGSGKATCTIQNLAPGTYNFVASFAGNSDYGPVTAQVAGYTVKSATAASGNSSGGGSSSDSGGSSSNNTAAAPKDSFQSAGDTISQSVSRSELQNLLNSGKSLILSSQTSSMTFGPGALKAILATVPATAGQITFSSSPADISPYPEAAALIGPRPVYDFTISYKDSNGTNMPVNVNFPAGSTSLTLNYASVSTELPGNLFMVYVDGSGTVTWLDRSSYNGGKILADVPHFSVYGVAYKAPASVFSDITGHWAKSDIEFVAARNLLSGTGNSLFSPDTAMTRGMFAAALGRLAGVNPETFQTRSFTDVKANAYYAPYVEWAAQNNILNGSDDKFFHPDSPVTREQMAVVLTIYASQTGYSIPAPLAAITFTDKDKISASALKDVTAMQRAGIIRAKDGNQFDPQAHTTRAEGSAMLRRFVETVTDPATASGWVMNDSGHWLYYQDGKALTGWQALGNLNYYFNADGIMHEGWKQSIPSGKWYYWTNSGAAIGWKKIDGKWYYFDENGIMAANVNIDGREIGPDGVSLS